MRILLVDDDEILAGAVSRGLTEQGYVVEYAGDGDTALSRADVPFDVIILDVMLGQPPDGVEVCRRLRERRVGARILMLTARDTVPDRVAGLEAGADDYLVKPFAFDELLARIRALARRHSAHEGSVRAAGRLELNTAAHTVTMAGTQVDVTRKEFALLELLLVNAGTMVSRATIHDQLWGFSEEPTSNLVEVYVGRLRKQLAEHEAAVTITTVRGAGYRLDDGA